MLPEPGGARFISVFFIREELHAGAEDAALPLAMYELSGRPSLG